MKPIWGLWLALGVGLAQPIQSRLASIHTFAVYYGNNALFAEQLGGFDLAIVQPNTLRLDRLKKLQAKGVRVVAYLSVGELEGSAVGTPASWILGTNPNWGSKYANTNQAGWREAVFNRAKDLMDIGFDGLFLDTLDTVDLYPQTKPGMVQIVQGLRQQHPEAIIVQNRGFAVLTQTAPWIDALMFEDFSTHYSFDRQSYSAANSDPKPLMPYQKRGLVILALDYALPSQSKLVARAYKRAKQYGFIPYVTTIGLNEIYPQPSRRP